jgi:hypothetical protein
MDVDLVCLLEMMVVLLFFFEIFLFVLLGGRVF